MEKSFDVIEHGNKEHAHMLGCAYAWFSQTYPEQWEDIRLRPAEVAIEEMRAIMVTQN